MNRPGVAEAIEDHGIQLNHMRVEELVAAPFLAGLVRAAEEALLVVVNTLRDANVPDSEL